MKVYVLWHSYETRDDYGAHDDEKLIGIYSTIEKAKKSIEEHKNLKGYRDLPIECFEITEREIDKSDWVDGFVTIRFGE